MTIGMPPAEVPISVELVRELLATQHPDLADEPLSIAGEGFDCVMIRIGEGLAARLPRRQYGVPLVDVERRWLPELAPRLPLPVPAPVRDGQPGAGYPWPWTIVPWFPGLSVDRAPLGPQAAEPLGRFLVALHQPAPEDAPRNPWRGVPLSTGAEAVAECHATLAERDDGLDADTLARVREVWGRALDVPIDVSPTWLHGDLHPRNVVGRDGSIAAVVDWGDVCHGDRSTDLSALWMLLPTADARARARRIIESHGEVSSATWKRARGWAVFFGSILMATGLQDGDTPFAEAGHRTLQRICED